MLDRKLAQRVILNGNTDLPLFSSSLEWSVNIYLILTLEYSVKFKLCL